MYIQEIILDGFKSYAQKTVVSGFDPQFNAITGDENLLIILYHLRILF
jgi:chromosome segregation ATPase